MVLDSASQLSATKLHCFKGFWMTEARVAFAFSSGFTKSRTSTLSVLLRRSLCSVQAPRCRCLKSAVTCLSSGDEPGKLGKAELDSTRAAPGHSKQAPKTRGPAAMVRYNVFRIRRQLRDVRTRYEDTAAVAQALKTEPGGILGADLDATPLGSMSAVQDLAIPTCPIFVPMSSISICSALLSYVSSVSDASSKARLLDSVDEALPRILAQVRMDMDKLADDTNTIFDGAAGGAETSSGVRSLLTLLHCARFHCNAPPPLSPPSMTALPIQISKLDCLDPSLVNTPEFSQHPLFASQQAGSALFPYALIAFRGTGVVRQSGAQYGAKIRSIEQLYLGWVDAPVRLIQKLFWHKKGQNESNSEEDTPRYSAKVRRVFPTPAIQLRRGLTALMELTLPIFTQEPTHQQWVLIYRDFEPDRARQHFAWSQRIVERAKDAVLNALHPNQKKARIDDETERFASPLGRSKGIHLEMYRDVPWGNVTHFYPSCAVSVVPKTRDLLRVDLLTLAGLISLGVTFARDVDHVLVTASALGTAIVYAARVAFAIRRALTVTHHRIAEERLSQMIGKDEAALARLATLAADQEFALAASVYVAKMISDPQVTASDVVRGAFKTDLDVNSDFWCGQLQKWGIVEADKVYPEDGRRTGRT